MPNVPPVLKYAMNLENFDTKLPRICKDFLSKLALNFFFVAKVFSLTVQFEAERETEMSRNLHLECHRCFKPVPREP